jgi:hypothetical protein
VVTKENEPRTLAYSWFMSSGDNTEVSNQYVRGFEVYKDELASTEVHRSSIPYKRMRSMVGPEKILEKSTDLSYCQPTGIGFMTRPNQTTSFHTDGLCKKFVEVLDVKPKPGSKNDILQRLKITTADIEANNTSISTYWALEFLEEYSNDSLILFSCFNSKTSYQEYYNSPETIDLR